MVMVIMVMWLASIDKLPSSTSASQQVRFVRISELNHIPLVHARGLHKSIFRNAATIAIV
jgi:hypothetical protein